MSSLSSRRIGAVRAARSRAGSPTMLVHVAVREDDQPDTRIAFVANRSVGGAVARNRVKRRLRAAAREARLPRAVDVVVDAHPGALDAPFVTLAQELTRLSARAARRVTR